MVRFIYLLRWKGNIPEQNTIGFGSLFFLLVASPKTTVVAKFVAITFMKVVYKKL
jgi:hypothetical protein